MVVVKKEGDISISIQPLELTARPGIIKKKRLLHGFGGRTFRGVGGGGDGGRKGDFFLCHGATAERQFWCK